VITLLGAVTQFFAIPKENGLVSVQTSSVVLLISLLGMAAVAIHMFLVHHKSCKTWLRRGIVWVVDHGYGGARQLTIGKRRGGATELPVLDAP